MLTEEGLRNIAGSKYKGTPYTPLDRLFDKLFWEPTIRVIPLWVAPNVLTLSGSIVMLGIGLLTLSHNNESLTGEIPLWLWPVAALCLHSYLTLDSIDGKQARKTQTSSPLGQLLDHGLDSSINANMIAILLIQSLRIVNPIQSALVLLSLEGVFIIASWEEYYMGVCRTSIGVLGVTEFALFTKVAFLLTWWYGYPFWDESLFFSLSLRDSFVYFTVIIYCWSLITMLYLVLTNVKSLYPLRDLCPFFAILASFAGYHISGAASTMNLFVTLSTASALGEITTSMIVCRMSKQRYPLLHPGLVLYTGLSAVSLFLGPLPYYYYWALLTVQITVQVSGFIITVRQIADFLHIRVLTIGKKCD